MPRKAKLTDFIKEEATTTRIAKEKEGEEKEKGKVYIFTGDGKGKTTASMGIALSFALAGKSVYIAQFLKGGEFTGEMMAFEKFPNVTFRQFGKYSIYMEDIKRGDLVPGSDMFVPFKENRKLAKLGFSKCVEAIKSGKYDVVVMDEICVAARMKLLKAKDVAKAARDRNGHVNIVMTGRHATKNLMREADVITEMKMVKHYYSKKLGGRMGVEY